MKRYQTNELKENKIKQQFEHGITTRLKECNGDGGY